MEFMSHSARAPTPGKREGSGGSRARRGQAERMRAYRSPEQLHNEHRRATGFEQQGVLAFGQFEIGRGSMVRNCRPTSTFLDKRPKGVMHPLTDGYYTIQIGDPGAYNPYDGDGGLATTYSLSARAGHSYNRRYRSFGSTSERSLHSVRGVTIR